MRYDGRTPRMRCPAMDFAFVLDPLPLLKAYKDSSIAMMRAVAAPRPSRLRDRAAGTCTGATAQRAPRAVPLTLHADDHDWYSAGAAEDRALKDFAAVMMRKDPPFDMEYVYSTYLLEAAEREGARVFNRPRAIRDYNEKFAIAAFRAVHRADARHARCGAHRRVHRRARRRDRQAARRHGRHVGVPRARRRPESQRHRRDRLASRRALGDGAAVHPARSPKATSASC